MSHSDLLYVQEQIGKQLVVMKEEKSRMMTAYFSQQSKERTEMEQLLASYTSGLEKLLTLADEHAVSSVVLVGSRVTIEYVELQSEDSFQITFPQEAEPGNNCISFLSPVGRQLLMASLGELISIITPSGPMDVRVTAIDNAVLMKQAEGGA